MFNEQPSAPLGLSLDNEREAKAFIQPFSSSSLPASSAAAAAAAAAASPQLQNRNRNGRRRARSILALALTLLALVAVAAWGAQPPSSHDEAAGVLSPPRLSPVAATGDESSLSSLPPPRRRRRSLPSSEAAVVAAALASTHGHNDTRSDADFPLAVVRAPLLTPAELLTLQHYARGSVYAEWGSGASTVLAAPMARRAVSIENQKSWCEEMVASADVDFWIKNNVLTYLCVDTGATGRFGTPTSESDPKLFSKYLDALDEAAAAVKLGATAAVTLGASATASATATKAATKKKGTRLSLSGFPAAQEKGTGKGKEQHNGNLEAHNNKLPTGSTSSSSSSSSSSSFTVVLVDGRFRVACALKALWHLDHARGVLLVHDWVSRGRQYHAPILRRYRLLAVVDRLAVLAPSSPPPEAGGAGGGAEEEKSRARWWAEAAEEMEKYSRDAA